LDPTNLSQKLQKHQNFDVELNANRNRLDQVVKSGEELIEAGHVQSETIKAKMDEVSQMWTDLVTASEKKGIKLQESSQQQQYNRGIEDLELWLSEIEGQLQSEDYGKDLTSVQNLFKKHALIEADVNSHQDRIDGVKIAAEQFCQAGHFDAENIKAKHTALADRYTALLKPMTSR
jgi:spectrin alpha